MRAGWCLILSSVLVVATARVAAGDERALPSKLCVEIARVQRAARDRDFATLGATMSEEFTWSFGDGPSREHALQSWREHPEVLKILAKLLANGCRRESDTTAKCAVAGRDKSSFDYRAGFKKRAGRWRFDYFVAGD